KDRGEKIRSALPPSGRLYRTDKRRRVPGLDHGRLDRLGPGVRRNADALGGEPKPRLRDRPRTHRRLRPRKSLYVYRADQRRVFHLPKTTAVRALQPEHRRYAPGAGPRPSSFARAAARIHPEKLGLSSRRLFEPFVA